MIINKQAKREGKQLFRACLVDGVLDDSRAVQAAQRIIAGAHRGRLAVLGHFYRLVRLDRAQHTANVQSAAPLPADLQAAVEAGLRLRYGPGLITAFAQRPSLIGGMRIQVGSDVYDGSVLAGLAALEKRF